MNYCSRKHLLNSGRNTPKGEEKKDMNVDILFSTIETVACYSTCTQVFSLIRHSIVT